MAGKKAPRIYVDKFGKEFMNLAFRCPAALYTIINNEAEKTDGNLSGVISRVLKKAYNFKG